MYFKFSLRYNKDKQQSDAYYRLVESYRNAEGRVCHRTILNLGFIDDDYIAEQLNQTARIRTARYEQKQSLFEPTDTVVIDLAETLYGRLQKPVAGDRQAEPPHQYAKPRSGNGCRHSHRRKPGHDKG